MTERLYLLAVGTLALALIMGISIHVSLEQRAEARATVQNVALLPEPELVRDWTGSGSTPQEISGLGRCSRVECPDLWPDRVVAKRAIPRGWSNTLTPEPLSRAYALAKERYVSSAAISISTVEPIYSNSALGPNEINAHLAAFSEDETWRGIPLRLLFFAICGAESGWHNTRSTVANPNGTWDWGPCQLNDRSFALPKAYPACAGFPFPEAARKESGEAHMAAVRAHAYCVWKRVGQPPWSPWRAWLDRGGTLESVLAYACSLVSERAPVGYCDG